MVWRDIGDFLEGDLLWSEGTRVVFLEHVGLARRPLLGRQGTRCVECIVFAAFIPDFVPCLPLEWKRRPLLVPSL